MPGDLQENEQLAAGLVGAVLTRDLLEPMGCTITSADGVVRLDTPLGEMAIEYSGAQVTPLVNLSRSIDKGVWSAQWLCFGRWPQSFTRRRQDSTG